MTMLAMWLGETSVALATDSNMTEFNEKSGSLTLLASDVKKLHVLPSGKVMFGIGFGDGPINWLRSCPCDKGHDYPHHWGRCSEARNVDDLEQFIRRDLQDGGFPEKYHHLLELWIAGFNEQGTLGAFTLDGAGYREELTPGDAKFNEISAAVCARIKVPLIANPSTGTQLLKKKYYVLKEQMGSDADALKETCQWLINLCEQHDCRFIGGELRYHEIRRC